MSQSVVRTCDQCGQPITGKSWEIGAWVAVVNGSRTETQTSKETCSQACVTSTVAAMLREVDERQRAKPDCHSIQPGNAA